MCILLKIKKGQNWLNFLSAILHDVCVSSVNFYRFFVLKFHVGCSTHCTATEKKHVCFFGTSCDLIVNIQWNLMGVVHSPHYQLWSGVIGFHKLVTLSNHMMYQKLDLQLNCFNSRTKSSKKSTHMGMSQHTPLKTGTCLGPWLVGSKGEEWHGRSLWWLDVLSDG